MKENHSNGPKTRAMQYSDIQEVVDLHLIAFHNFFLTFLGGVFLKQLYQGFFRDATGINYVYERDGKLLGFVCGSIAPKGFYSRLLKTRWWAFALASIPAILRDPFIIPRLLRALSMSTQTLPQENCATLMSIAIDPCSQGQGIGQSLVETFLHEAKMRGCKFVNLTTDSQKNDPVNHFYSSQGFKLLRTYSTPEGRDMNEYLIKL